MGDHVEICPEKLVERIYGICILRAARGRFSRCKGRFRRPHNCQAISIVYSRTSEIGPAKAFNAGVELGQVGIKRCKDRIQRW